jgi:hypothetical protein
MLSLSVVQTTEQTAYVIQQKTVRPDAFFPLANCLCRSPVDWRPFFYHGRYRNELWRDMQFEAQKINYNVRSAIGV